MTKLRSNLMASVAVSLLALVPSFAQADDGTGCTVLAQAAASGLAARISADDQTIKPPKSVTALTCLDNFFNGVGLNVLTNLLDPTSLLNSVEGKICALATSAWAEHDRQRPVRFDHHWLQRRLRRPGRRFVLPQADLWRRRSGDRQHHDRAQCGIERHVPHRRRASPDRLHPAVLVQLLGASRCEGRPLAVLPWVS